MPKSNYTLFDPSKRIQQLKKDIEKLKEDTDAVDFNWEKVHHFTVPYISIILMIIFALCFFLYYKRTQRKKHSSNANPVDIEMTSLKSLHVESL